MGFRLCKKDDHRPAKCKENSDQKQARMKLEDQMSEAMVR